MKKMLFTILLTASMVIHAHAYTVYCTNCSDKFTQALERVTGLEQLAQLQQVYQESIQQTVQQIEMVRQNIEQYKNMVQNTLQLPQQLINTVAGELGRFAQLTASLQTLRADAMAMADIFDKNYLDVSVFQDLASAPRHDFALQTAAIRDTVDTMAREVDRATKATFQVSGQQLKDLEMSGKLESYINELLSTPEGQQQALMAGNQLAALQIHEARQLRALLATSVQSDLASQLKREKQEQLSEEMRRHMFEMELDTTPHEDSFFDFR